MAVVGIDLGTTNTVVGIAKDGQVTAIRDADGDYLIPSVVSFHPSGSILVGRAAKDRRVIDAANTVYSIKRLIGRSWNSEEVGHARARFPFEMREGPGQAALVVARGETYTLPEISAFVLRHAKALAEKSLGEPVDRAVITVPANFNDLQRAATKVAGRVAGLEVLRILNEPTAAALAYGYGKGKGERVAIYDFGGGTFDVTLLDLSGNVFEVLATAGNTFLGGDDIDIAIAERMAGACLERHRIDARADPQVFERLRFHAEKLKVQLSAAPEASVQVPDVGHDVARKPLRLDFRMTQIELDSLATPLVDRTFEVCAEALEIARVSPKDIHHVVLVGGSTRLPIVRRRVAEYFGQPPLDRINPDEVVAIGAAIQANALTGQERRRSVIPKPPMPAARAQAIRSEPPIGKTRPFGLQAKGSRPPPTPSSGAERRRVITGVGLGPSPQSSPPPPLSSRRPPPPKKGGTLGGVGGPTPQQSEPVLDAPTRPSSERPPPPTYELTMDDDGQSLADPFEPTTPIGPDYHDDEPTKVSAPPGTLEAGVELGPSLHSPPSLAFDELDDLNEQTAIQGPPPARTSNAPPSSRGGASTRGLPPLPPLPPPGSSAPPPHPTSTPRAATPRAAPAPPSLRKPAKDLPAALSFPEPLRAPSLPPSGSAPAPGSGALGASVASITAPLAPFTAADAGAHRLRVSEPPRAERPPLPLLVDVTPLSLCVETVSGFRDVIIARNTPVPCEQSHTFVTAFHGQELARVRVGQGESARFDENTFLGEVELSGLRKAPRGEVQIVVTFSLDTDGMLNVRAADAETGQASSARLRLVGLPDADEVGRMTARHLQHRTQ